MGRSSSSSRLYRDEIGQLSTILPTPGSDEHLGAAVRDARKRQGLTQQDLAAVLNVPRSAVSEMENGTRKISALELAAICNVLEIPATDFLPAPKATRPRFSTWVVVQCTGCRWVGVAPTGADTGQQEAVTEEQKSQHQRCP